MFSGHFSSATHPVTNAFANNDFQAGKIALIPLKIKRREHGIHDEKTKKWMYGAIAGGTPGKQGYNEYCIKTKTDA